MIKKRRNKVGSLERKMLLLIIAGTSFGMTRRAGRQVKIVQEFIREWRKINQADPRRVLKGLRRKGFLKNIEENLVVTKRGEDTCRLLRADDIIIPSQKWDGYWRLVMYDIEASRKRVRDGLRYQLLRLGFYELQKSVFVTPYPCKEAILELARLYRSEKGVCYVLTNEISQEKRIKKYFQIP